MQIRIAISGVDITDEISVQDVIVDRQLSRISDNATLICNDTSMSWGDWDLRVGQRIDIRDGDRALIKGWVSAWSVASGIASIEASTAVPSARSTHSATLDGTLREIIDQLCAMDGLSARYTGDFSPRLRCMWMATESAGEVLCRLSDLYDFAFVADADGFRFVEIDALKKAPKSREVIIREDDSYAFEISPKWAKIAVTNGSSRATATADGVGGDLQATVIWHGDATESDLAVMARRILARRNRTSTMSLTRPTEDGIWCPGEVVVVTAPDALHSGDYLITGVRAYVARGAQAIKGVRLS